MPLMSDIFDIPAQVHQGDFVLRLTEGVKRPADTLNTYVVTPHLGFADGLNWWGGALRSDHAQLISCTLKANDIENIYSHLWPTIYFD